MSLTTPRPVDHTERRQPYNSSEARRLTAESSLGEEALWRFIKDRQTSDEAVILPYRKEGRLDSYYIQSFTEESDPELVGEAWRIHGRGYVNEGFVYNAALLSDGTLPTDIDKARGPYVDYYLSSGWDVNGNYALTTGSATMRKINIPAGGTVADLPAYNLCADALDPDFKEYLEALEDPATNLKEIAALARTEAASPVAVFELFRDAVQESRGRGEIWFFSIVASTYKSLAENFGTNAIRQVGQPISFTDDRINESIKLIPAVVDTARFIDQIREAFESTTDRRRSIQHARSFIFFTEGLSDDELTPESAALRGQIQSRMPVKQRVVNKEQ